MLWYTEYTAELSVTLPHFVRCANCGCRYVYEAEYVSSSSGFALYNIDRRGTQRGVRDEARAEFVKQLADPRHYDPVPCPDCFHYQPYMRGALVARYNWLAPAGGVLFGVGLFGPISAVLLFNAGLWIAAGLVGAGGLGISLTGALALLWRARLRAGFQPNRGRLHQRERIARERAVRLVAYQARQARRVRRAYTRRRRRGHRRARPPLTVDWWLPPSDFYGEGFVLGLSDDERVEVPMPSNAEPGDVVEVRPLTPDAEPFRVRLLAMRAHPGEYRLE